MRVLTFSQKFPAKHPRAGEPTNFTTSIATGNKGHTIRSGKRWKVGERFSARVWSDRPYASKQIEFAEIEILKIWDFEITASDYLLNGKKLNLTQLKEVANNDGLEVDDFELWFAIHPKLKKDGFSGQVICWNGSIDY
jgi:hypothetical protein